MLAAIWPETLLASPQPPCGRKWGPSGTSGKGRWASGGKCLPLRRGLGMAGRGQGWGLLSCQQPSSGPPRPQPDWGAGVGV